MGLTHNMRVVGSNPVANVLNTVTRRIIMEWTSSFGSVHVKSLRPQFGHNGTLPQGVSYHCSNFHGIST